MRRNSPPTLLCAVLLALLAGGAHAAADPAKGKTLHDKYCTECHIRNVGGDGSGFYTRADRKMKNLLQLQQRVAFCNTQTNAGLFPEDEANIAAWLNDKFYKFK